jgi:lipopolysaccharide export system ATP-binding protein
MSNDCLTTENLIKRYGSRTVVNGVSLQVHPGEAVGLLGRNGAGKTTTFYMIVGLVKPDGGEVGFRGQDIGKLPMFERARLGITYLPQEASVFRKLSVRDNLMAVAETLPIKREERLRRVEKLLEDLGVKHVAGNLAYTLSGGERRRVEIARALVIDPVFILLDEPFAGIDPIAVLDIQKIIGQLRDSGIGILISDHNVRETLGVCDRAYILNDGEVMKEGSPREVAEDSEVRSTYLGEGFKLDSTGQAG